jgi:hypothetical protein
VLTLTRHPADLKPLPHLPSKQSWRLKTLLFLQVDRSFRSSTPALVMLLREGTVSSPPDPPLLLPLETLPELTLVKQGPIQKPIMEPSQVQSVNNITPPPSPDYPHPSQTSEVKDPQGLSILTESTREEAAKPVPPQYFQVSDQYPSSTPHGYTESLSCLKESRPLSSPFSLTPLSPPHRMSPKPLSAPHTEPEDKQPERLQADQLLHLILHHRKYAKESISACPSCEKPTPSSHLMACTGCHWTLISRIYPSPYVWNPPILLPTYPIVRIHNRLLCISDTDSPYKTQDALIFEQEGHPTLIYHDHSHFNRVQEYPASTTHPYGWSAAAEEYCISSGYHPNCLNPDALSIVEAEFIQESLQSPERRETLDDHISVIHSHTSGEQLQWLSSSPTPMTDNYHQRIMLTELYAKIRKHEGKIYHSKKGLRITVPEEKWINWRTFSPDSQKEFTQVAWAQMTQFDKEAMMTALSQGKLGEKPIYINFGQEAKHDDYWNTELESVRHYAVNLVTETLSYPYYNPYVISNLAATQPLTTTFDWEKEHPTYVHLPYSQSNLQWDENTQAWKRFGSSDTSSSDMSEDESSPPPSMIDCSSPEVAPYLHDVTVRPIYRQKASVNPAFQPQLSLGQQDSTEERRRYIIQRFQQTQFLDDIIYSPIPRSPIDEFEQEDSHTSGD